MTGYAEIAKHYRTLIQDGTLVPGDQMPSQWNASKEHDVNRSTIIRAYAALKSEGLVISHPGRGVIVASPNKGDGAAAVPLFAMVPHEWYEQAAKLIGEPSRMVPVSA